jgi:hypothetical protein
MARSSLSDSEAEAYDINSSASVPMAVKACKCDLWTRSLARGFI